MSRQLSSRGTDALLNALEDLELPLLSWGVTSGTLAHDEVLETIDRVLGGSSGRGRWRRTGGRSR